MAWGCCRKAVLAALRECKHRINPPCAPTKRRSVALCCAGVTANTSYGFVDYRDAINKREYRDNTSLRALLCARLEARTSPPRSDIFSHVDRIISLRLTMLVIGARNTGRRHRTVIRIIYLDFPASTIISLRERNFPAVRSAKGYDWQFGFPLTYTRRVVVH